MQRGCLKPQTRKRGPDVWQFRWSEVGPDSKRLHYKKIVGTVEQYPDENAARQAVVGLVSEIATSARPMNTVAMTIAQLCDHFAQRELAKDNSWRSHATKKIYQAWPAGFVLTGRSMGLLAGTTRLELATSAVTVQRFDVIA